MGRRKKKVRAEKPAIAKPTDSKATRKNTATTSSQLPVEARPEKTATHIPRRNVSMTTCAAGMFLTLVLGLYLGTLMPGVTYEVRQEAGETLQNSTEKSSERHLEPELAAMIKALEKKSQESPDSAADWINLGNIYFDANKPEKAIVAYERALKLAPDNADALTDLGIMYREIGDFEQAIECFHKAIAINPHHENALYNEGVVYSMDLKQKEQAIKAWQRLLDLNPQARAPNGTPVENMIQQLR